MIWIKVTWFLMPFILIILASFLYSNPHVNGLIVFGFLTAILILLNTWEQSITKNNIEKDKNLYPGYLQASIIRLNLLLMSSSITKWGIVFTVINFLLVFFLKSDPYLMLIGPLGLSLSKIIIMNRIYYFTNVAKNI